MLKNLGTFQDGGLQHNNPLGIAYVNTVISGQIKGSPILHYLQEPALASMISGLSLNLVHHFRTVPYAASSVHFYGTLTERRHGVTL